MKDVRTGAARGPVAVRWPGQPEYALHVATAGAVYRRAPTDLAPGWATALVRRRPQLPAGVAGAFGEQRLLLPITAGDFDYMLPSILVPEFAVPWRRCPILGLELPSDVADEVAFDQQSGCSAFVSPSSLGVRDEEADLASIAWWVLGQVGVDDLVRVCLDLAFRLDAVGFRSVPSIAAAQIICERWHVGQGLVSAALSDRPWLVPSCLRWVVRELCAAKVANARGRSQPQLLAESAQFSLHRWFPHLADGSAPDFADALFALWLLHESFHGVESRTIADMTDLLSGMTALSLARPEHNRVFERLVTWNGVWSVPDDHPAGEKVAWNGQLPSSLRNTFREITGLGVMEWYAAAHVLLLLAWAAADDPIAPVHFGLSSAGVHLGVDCERSDRTVALLVSELSQTTDQLGERVLSTVPSYSGLGSTSQTEASPLRDRPLLLLPGGVLQPSSPDAMASCAARVPRRVIEASGRHGDRGAVGGTLGRMFEAYGWDVVARASGRHVVLNGSAIDAAVGRKGGPRADAIVCSADCAVVLEFSLQSPTDRAQAGHVPAVKQQLESYAKKIGQALSTDLDGKVRRILPARLRVPEVGHLVVVDDEIPFAPVHQEVVRAAMEDCPPRFVVRLVDLEALIDLVPAGVSVPGALISWQRGARDVPFAVHLHDLARLVGHRKSRVTEGQLAFLHTLFPQATAA